MSKKKKVQVKEENGGRRSIEVRRNRINNRKK
jgi:hypothetical protein